jgi:hypothetical protein
MMFLQFFIWGAWYATGGNYMKSHGMANLIYLAYMTSATGAIISPFFLGMIADRFFPVQKVLGVMHILSGIFVFCAPFFAETPFYSAPLFLGCLLLHMLCYMPTVNLAAATAFHLLKNGKQFPLVRIRNPRMDPAGIVSKLFMEWNHALALRHWRSADGIIFTPNIPPTGADENLDRDLMVMVPENKIAHL